MPALQGQQERQAVVPDLHPKLQAAIERDGVTLAKLAQVVGLDVRTVARWGSEDEYGSRAAAFRRLEDVIAGRARIVETELGAAVLEELGEGVPRAEVLACLRAMQTKIDELDETFRKMPERLGFAPHGNFAESFAEKSYTTHLQAAELPGITEAMHNTTLLQQVAHTVWERSRGQGMVSLHKKVPKDHVDRLEAAARAHGMSDSDYLRVLIELHTPPVPKEA